MAKILNIYITGGGGKENSFLEKLLIMGFWFSESPLMVMSGVIGFYEIAAGIKQIILDSLHTRA